VIKSEKLKSLTFENISKLRLCFKKKGDKALTEITDNLLEFKEALTEISLDFSYDQNLISNAGLKYLSEAIP